MKNIFKLLQGFIILCALVLWTAPGALAQQGNGTISGTVADATGAAVPSATVVLTQQKTGVTQTVQANASGFYVFPSVAPSQYKVTVVSKGFKRYEKVDIPLQADQNVTANVTMSIGAAGIGSCWAKHTAGAVL